MKFTRVTLIEAWIDHYETKRQFLIADSLRTIKRINDKTKMARS